MEHLTKAQIVLLTLFVSFVASMATGIVVVTLMQQSPEPISQTINNVIERTIEKITPGPTIEKTKSVIIKDEDLIVAAIDRNIKSTVALRATVGEGGVLPAGVGTIISSDGLVITDRWNFGLGDLYTTINGVQYTLNVISNEKGNTLGLGRLVPVTGTSTPAFIPVTMGNPDLLRLGQTAIVIGGRDGKTITTGLINNLESHTITDKETKIETKVLDNVGVSTRFSGSSNGAPIINLSGDVIGFLSINESAGSQIGVPANEAKSIIDVVLEAAAIKKI